MTVFFTADLHLGHVRIIELCGRPFPDVDAMNAEIIGKWNAAVSPRDTVFVLGDVALGRLRDTLPLVRELQGRKKLVPGNHDRCWSGHKRVRPADYALYRDVGFEILPDQTWHHGLAAHLCHLPIAGDSAGTDRFLGRRPIVAPGEWLIHGHVHNAWRRNERQINVGVDVWNYRPVPIDLVREEMAAWPS